MKYFGAALIIAGLGFLQNGPLSAQGEPSNPSPAPAESRPGSALKKDVLILIHARISDPVIISYIRKNAAPGERATSQDVIDLKQAGASDALLTAYAEATANSPAGSTTYASPDSSTSSVYLSSGYPYGYSYDSYWPYYPYGYYGYPYGYGYPYWGFGVSVPFFFHSRDGHFHHVDHFHDGHFAHGHFHGGTVSPHGGFVSHGGGHGGGGHR